VSDALFSSSGELDHLAKLLRGYLRLPFSDALLPGRFVETVVARIKGGQVLPTYDFADVIKPSARLGWQVKSTKEATPVTWKRAKIPNSVELIANSRASSDGLQSLGDAIIDFCNHHAKESLQLYDLDRIGYCRVVLRPREVVYFERELISRTAPDLFDPEQFSWRWSVQCSGWTSTCCNSAAGLLTATNGYHAFMQAQLTGGSSLRTPMAFSAYEALGETKHHEYYDGMCVVNPPNRRHVFALVRLRDALLTHCPSGFFVYPEWGWRIAPGVEVLPDLMVAPPDAPDDDQLAVPPLLVVEIGSPSTRDVDRGRKKELYEQGGASWYWLVDLEQPELVVFKNDGNELVEVQRIGAGGALTQGPFSILVDPGLLAQP